MALIMIFLGSCLGLFVGGLQVSFQDASLGHAFLTYLMFALGFPAVTGTLVWLISSLRIVSRPTTYSIRSTPETDAAMDYKEA